MNVPALDNTVPSYALKVNVTAPFALATGTYVTPPRLALAISSPAETALPLYIRVPVLGREVKSIETKASESASE